MKASSFGIPNYCDSASPACFLFPFQFPGLLENKQLKKIKFSFITSLSFSFVRLLSSLVKFLIIHIHENGSDIQLMFLNKIHKIVAAAKIFSPLFLPPLFVDWV